MIFNLGLIGFPLGHSLSPAIHRAALESCGLQGNYSLFPIYPDDQQGLKDLLTCVLNGEIHGLNVTIPHKQNVIPFLDELTPTANAIGAVNTIFEQNGKLTGDNTDAQGFFDDLKKFLENRESEFDTRYSKNDDRISDIHSRKSAFILGAGGSARAVVHALINDGWDITLAARRTEQAEELASRFPIPNSRISITEYRPTSLDSLFPTLVVNTTPLGMSPNIEVSPWPDGLPFPPDVAVYDLVYNPRETKLVKEAHAAGLPAITGLGMLIEQAALAFEIWTGYDPPRDALWKTVEGRQ